MRPFTGAFLSRSRRDAGRARRRGVAAEPDLRFGEFELEARARRLTRGGRTVPLQPQPMRLLRLLLGRPGALVTRRELRDELWEPGTHVDFELGINFAVRRLRQALGDSAESPRYVETVPREGYRWIADIQKAPHEGRAGGKRRKLTWLGATVGALGALVSTLGSPDREPRLAVLPFEVSALGSVYAGSVEAASTTIDPPAALGRVLAEELVTELTRTSGSAFGILATESSFPAGRPASAAPDYVVRGRLVASGGAWRLTVHLTRVQDGTVAWGDGFETTMSELPGALARAAGAIGAALGGPPGLARISSPVSEDVYRTYLRGRVRTVHGANTANHEELLGGMRDLEEVLAVAPHFARGHAALAHSYLMLVGVEPLRDVLPPAEQAARRAVELDPGLPEAHSLLGMALFFQLRWAEAGESLARGVELGPGVSKTHQLYGAYLSARGRHDEAVVELRRAVDLDPISVRKHWELAQALYFAQRWEEATDAARAALSLEPDHFPSRSLLVYVLAAAGDETAALDELRRWAGAYAELPDGLRRWTEDHLEHLEHRGDGSLALRAILASALGRTNEALGLLEAACGTRADPFLVSAFVDPRLAPVRRDPRFDAVSDCLLRPAS